MARYKSVVDGVLLPLGTGTAAAVIANQLPQNQKDSRARKDAAKKLKKVEPNFSKSAGFNERAAQQAFDLVMKMDTETARMFTDMVVSDVVEETIEKNLRTFQRQLDQVIAKRAEALRVALVRKAIKDGEDTLPYAEALAEITKAKSPYDYGYRFQESDFNRDPSSGKFRMKVKHTMDRPLTERQASSMGIVAPGKQLKGKDLARYQDEYRQVVGFLDSVNQTVGIGNANVVLHVRDRKTGDRWAEMVTGKRPPKEIMEDPTIEVQGAEARPDTLTAGGAAFGLQNALGRTELSENSAHAMRGHEQGFDEFTQNWTTPGDRDAYNDNAAAYRRVAAGSKYVMQIAPRGSKLQMAAAFGQFAGEMGPQAETVIGPTARKTAYRYRGTEKTPDREMVSEYEKAINNAKTQSTYVTGRGGVPKAPTQQAYERITTQRRSPTWDERNLGRGVIVQHLEGKLPTTELAELQLASGNTPPSEGVMLNAEGQIVTQAVGYADDHYLPFDLKHLKDLKGGEYIRTRSYGGLTSEDIYTGLASGARQVTVVSHNGVFTMEFEPDFRGGRRHNDKARRMTRRYEQILDAVQSGQVDRTSIDPLVRQKIVQSVREEFPRESPATIQSAIKSRIDQYKASPDLQPEDEEVILELARARAASPDAPSHDARDYIEQITNDRMQRKAIRFQLDGPGYKAAQEALAEQFPYYIKTRADVRGPKDTISPKLDRGYVEPGRIRPTEANAGSYGTIRNKGTGFISASQTNYVGARAVKRGGTSDGGPGEEKAVEGGEKKALPKDTVAGIIKERQYRNAAENLHKVFNDPGVLQPSSRTGVLEILAKPADQISDPLNATQLSAAFEYLERNRNNFAQHPQALKALDDYKLAVQVPQEYSPELALHWTRTPIPFPEHPYQAGASLDERQEEVRKINARSQSVFYGGNLSSLDEGQMKQEVDSLSDIYRIVKDHPELQSRDLEGAESRKKITDVLLADRGYNESAVELLLEKPNKIQKRLEDVQRMRTLMASFRKEGVQPQNYTARVMREEPQEVHVEALALPAGKQRTPQEMEWHKQLKIRTIQDHMDQLRLGMQEAGPGNTAEHEAAINIGHAMVADAHAIDDPEIRDFKAETDHLLPGKQRRSAH